MNGFAYPSMHADGEPDEQVVPMKRTNNGEQSSAEKLFDQGEHRRG